MAPGAESHGPAMSGGRYRQPPVSSPSRSARSAESCIRKADVARGFTPGFVGLADTKAEDEAAARRADFPFAYGD